MLLRNYNKYNEIIDYDLNNYSYKSIEAIENDDDIMGKFCVCNNQMVALGINEGEILILFNTGKLSFVEITKCKYKITKNNTELLLVDSKNKKYHFSNELKDEIIQGDFTQYEHEDFNFFCWIKNIFNNKKRQNILISSYSSNI